MRFNLINRAIKSEEKASKHINVLAHYDDDTLLDKSGKLIKIIKVSGLNFVTADKQALDIYKIRRNHLLKNFSSEFALYFWDVRRKVYHYPDGEFPEGYARCVNDRYKNKIMTSEMFHTELYLALMTKQPEGIISKGFSLLKRLSLMFDKRAKLEYLAQRHKDLCEATLKLMSSLSDYDCKLLSVYEKNGVKFSEPLAFLSQIINFDTHSVPLVIQNAASVLPRKRLFFNSRAGTIEMRAADDSKKFIAILSIKAYSPVTYQGLLDELSKLRCEYIITQSCRFYDRQVAKARLRDQQNEMLQSREESISQTEEIDDAFDEAASGEVGYGKHHLTLACYAETQSELNKHVSNIVSCFADADIACVREDIACEMGYWAQLPGNFNYICRAADISTLNMAGFASLHNYPMGKLTGNHWGDAVTVFETLSGSPYYFNFHYKDVGNFLVFGAMGSGKTLLVGFLILQSMKFGGKRIIFDKDRGLELTVRAMRGVYEVIKPGRPTGFNPCQLPDTPENRKFLTSLFKKMLTVNGETLTESDIEIVVRAIDGMYRLEPSDRQLFNLASYFGVKKSASLRARFDQWHSEGTHAWLFDNAEDTLNLNPDVIGFDISHILADKECKTPALMYLICRANQALEGQRGILFIDEGWFALDDDFFKALIENWSRISRKLDKIFGLATQVANDAANSKISRAIIESAFCKIFFPNPSADRKVYIDDYGLSEYEYFLVKNLPDDLHFFLLVFGRGANKESVVVRINMDGLDDDIAVISARERSVALFDQLRAELGNDPRVLLPAFHLRRRSMV